MIAATSQRVATGEKEVRDFLSDIGLNQYAESLLNTGFYVSLRVLEQATYEELLDCNVRPVHAQPRQIFLDITATNKVTCANPMHLGQTLRNFKNLESELTGGHHK